MKQRYQKLCPATLRPLDEVIALSEKNPVIKGGWSSLVRFKQTLKFTPYCLIDLLPYRLIAL